MKERSNISTLTISFEGKTLYELSIPVKTPSKEGDNKTISKMYFVAGAGNDRQGWNYTQRFENIWSSIGISGFTKLNVSLTSDILAKSKVLPPLPDLIYTLDYRNKVSNRIDGLIADSLPENPHVQVRKRIQKDKNSKILAKDTQLNLCGYSFGSVVVSQAAIQICDEGFVIDNLVLIGSPVSINSELFQQLLKYKADNKICQIIRNDIKDDLFSNPKDIFEFKDGIPQNSDSSGPHFDLARPDDPSTPNIDESKIADDKIRELGQILISKGVK